MRRDHPERQSPKKVLSGLVARRFRSAARKHSVMFPWPFPRNPWQSRTTRVDAAITRPRNLKTVPVGTAQCEVGVSSFAADFTEKATELPRKPRVVETLKFRRAFERILSLENPLRMRRKHPERQLSKKGSSGLVARRCVPLHGITPCCFRGCFRQIRGKAVRPVRADAAILSHKKPEKKSASVRCNVMAAQRREDLLLCHAVSTAPCEQREPKARPPLLFAALRVASG